MQEYLQHLHDYRWEIIKYISGKGLEISDHDFLVLPRAIKAVKEDKPELYKDMVRFKVADYFELTEVKDNDLDFIFYTAPQSIDLEKINKWIPKIKKNGYIILHSSVFRIFKKINGQLKLQTPETLPQKNVGLMRLGAIGDNIQVTSLIHAFKKQGYHVTMYSQRPASAVLHNNPEIDELIETDKEIVRNNELRLYWDWLEKKHEKFVNLCGSVEDAWLPGSSRPQFYWPVEVRNRYLNTNYVEFMHQLAGLKYNLNVKFYPTDEEIKWAKEERAKIKAKKIICWALNGSSLHKVYPHLDAFVARTMLQLKDTDIVLLGGTDAVILQGGWQEEPRVHCNAGIWNIRETLTFVQQHADLLIGPETGILNAMCCEQLPKILFLSHSSKNNLTRDWKNTISLSADNSVCNNLSCCRHRLHQNEESFKYITRDETTGVALCQAMISVDDVWNNTVRILK